MAGTEPGEPLMAWENIRRILVIRRDNIGDLICTTPLLHGLRRRFPDALIDVLANSYNAPILAGNPDIDAVITYTKAKHGRLPRPLALYQEWRVYRRLKAKKYHLVIHANPVHHPRTERLIRYLKPRYALGVSDSGDAPYDPRLTSQEVQGTHHVERVFHLLAPLGVTGAPGPLFVQGRHAIPVSRVPVLGIHISSRRPCNRWPLEHFAQVIANRVEAGWSCRLFWAPNLGGDAQHPGDDKPARALAQRFGASLTPMATLSLEQLRLGLAKTDLVLCCDGGALHMAAGLGRPTVALFGCTDPAMWGPWGVPNRCLNGQGNAADIAAEEVVQALDSLHRELSS